MVALIGYNVDWRAIRTEQKHGTVRERKLGTVWERKRGTVRERNVVVVQTAVFRERNGNFSLISTVIPLL